MRDDRQGDGDWYSTGAYDEVAVSAQGGLAAKIFHGQVERGIRPETHFRKVLEVGALTGQHLPYVRHSFDSWTLSDLIPPERTDFGDPRVRFSQQDVHEMTFADGEFDRVAATCVLHHLDRPMDALEEMRRVCRPGGVLTILLPVDPGWMYEVALEVTTMRRARQRGLEGEARRARALGHRNHFKSLRWQMGQVFREDEVHVYSWPLPGALPMLSAFTSWKVTKAGG